MRAPCSPPPAGDGLCESRDALVIVCRADAGTTARERPALRLLCRRAGPFDAACSRRPPPPAAPAGAPPCPRTSSPAAPPAPPRSAGARAGASVCGHALHLHPQLIAQQLLPPRPQLPPSCRPAATQLVRSVKSVPLAAGRPPRAEAPSRQLPAPGHPAHTWQQSAAPPAEARMPWHCCARCHCNMSMLRLHPQRPVPSLLGRRAPRRPGPGRRAAAGAARRRRGGGGGGRAPPAARGGGGGGWGGW